MSEREPIEDEVAAEDPGAIGGRAPEGEDPAMRPVEEAGGGESEGFEQAEADLVENAEHGDGGGPSPTRAAFPPEAASDESTAEYGEADDAHPPDGPSEA